MNLNGKRALVTGGAVRIGKAITQALQTEDVEVIVHFRKSEAEAHALSSSVIQADLGNPAEYESLMERASKTFGPIDILVNNAAVFHHSPLSESDTDSVLKELHPNLLAPLALIRGFAAQTSQGKIVNLLDRRITSHDTQYIPYMLSKKGLEELTKLAAIDLAPRIAVNAVAPGAVLPPPDKVGDTAWEPAGTIPLERRPSPEDIAEAALYLLKSDILTGQTLFVDGGQNLLGE